MTFFRVRVRKTIDFFIVVQDDSQSAAEAKALAFETNPTNKLVGGQKVNGFPQYNVVNTVLYNDDDNAASKQYAKNIANEAQEALQSIVSNTASNISTTEFYLLREKIDDLESTITAILS